MEITVNVMNELLNRYATKLAQKQKLKVNPENFVFHLEENLNNDLVMTAGNPVIIRMNLGIFSKVLIKALKNKHEISTELRNLNEQIANCYMTGNRFMLHSLALVPISDILARNAEIMSWKKAIEAKVLLLLANKEIYYGVNIQVTAIHIDSGLRIKLNQNIHSRDTRDQTETKLRIQARHDLTILVRKPKEDTSSTPSTTEGLEE